MGSSKSNRNAIANYLLPTGRLCNAIEGVKTGD